MPTKLKPHSKKKDVESKKLRASKLLFYTTLSYNEMSKKTGLSLHVLQKIGQNPLLRNKRLVSRIRANKNWGYNFRREKKFNHFSEKEKDKALKRYSALISNMLRKNAGNLTSGERESLKSITESIVRESLDYYNKREPPIALNVWIENAVGVGVNEFKIFKAATLLFSSNLSQKGISKKVGLHPFLIGLLETRFKYRQTRRKLNKPFVIRKEAYDFKSLPKVSRFSLKKKYEIFERERLFLEGLIEKYYHRPDYGVLKATALSAAFECLDYFDFKGKYAEKELRDFLRNAVKWDVISYFASKKTYEKTHLPLEEIMQI